MRNPAPHGTERRSSAGVVLGPGEPRDRRHSACTGRSGTEGDLWVCGDNRKARVPAHVAEVMTSVERSIRLPTLAASSLLFGGGMV